MKHARILVLILCAFVDASAARADLVMTLSSSVQNSARGRELVFSGTLTNTSSTERIFVNDLVANLIGASANELTYQANAFFANVPGILEAGESYSNSELFHVSLGANSPANDYSGSVTLRGGSDISASVDLATSSFKVLSPAVNLVATDPSASEFGNDSGTITISRSGGTDIDLPVAFAIVGTAVNGSAYSAIAPALNIPAGSNSASLTIAPLPNDIAEGDRTVILTLSNSALYNSGASPSDAVIIHDKPADAWRFENFGANANDPAAADNADWDHDGIANLLEFALGLDPKNADRAGVPAGVLRGNYLEISYVPNSAATDVNYSVEGSFDLVNWSVANVEDVSLANPNPPGLRTFRYKIPASEKSPAFLRLRISRSDSPPRPDRIGALR